jgi:hypothetical protein
MSEGDFSESIAFQFGIAKLMVFLSPTATNIKARGLSKAKPQEIDQTNAAP